ncbi:Hypothetical protein FKW44_002397 [Caligus rogercresseyi]|uniref:Uncharacterized protein n=1 Tax=Caligus rogercresseyi TaxID=217165 RepID=A0A7T8KK61_CALRO|nr:Hypothetical protein FKW44_002397 [Caligus rogercresseyi]
MYWGSHGPLSSVNHKHNIFGVPNPPPKDLRVRSSTTMIYLGSNSNAQWPTGSVGHSHDIYIGVPNPLYKGCLVPPVTTMTYWGSKSTAHRPTDSAGHNYDILGFKTYRKWAFKFSQSQL